MMPPLHIPKVHPSDASSQVNLLVRAMTTCLVFACMLWLGVSVYSNLSKTTETAAEVNLSPGVDPECTSATADGQIAAGLGNVTLNIEAYNRKREKDIADASRKLLSLAISLKSDLEDTPGSGLSPDAIRKAKEIEKLAHDVKEMMKINIIDPQDRLRMP
jgi:hypothetical protein